MDYRTLRLDVSAPIARIVLARPAAANRIDARTLTELADAIAVIESDASLLVTIVAGDGPDFCLGWDAETRQELLAAHATKLTAGREPFAALAATSMPTVCALNGRVESAGLELALCCDVRLASDDLAAAMPDVAEGHLPIGGGTQRLPRIIGKAAALEVLLTGAPMSATEAQRCGLVSRLAPRSELSSAADELARRIAGRGPLGLRYAKEAVCLGLEMPLDRALRYETDLSLILQTTFDRGEGVRAFFEKRPPRFEGR